MKRHKNQTSADNKITMIAINDKIIKEINGQYAKKAQKQQLLAEYQRKYKVAKNTNEYREKYELSKKIDELIKEIEDIEDQKELTSYYINSYDYLNDYRNVGKESKAEKEAAASGMEVKEKEGKGTISAKYIQQCLGSMYQKETEENLTCQECGVPRIINHKEARAICEECGFYIMYQDNDMCNEFSEEIEVLTQFSYKTINHFKEWISKLLARESSKIPVEVISNLLEELRKDRIDVEKDKHKITKERIKSYLKKLKYNKLYEDIPAIRYKIARIEPIKISKELEAKLINMFEQIQEPYLRHKPPSRINFLSYAYVIYKFAEILGETELMNELSQLKSEDKIKDQDVIFRNVAKDLLWPFKPTT